MNSVPWVRFLRTASEASVPANPIRVQRTYQGLGSRVWDLLGFRV